MRATCAFLPRRYFIYISDVCVFSTTVPTCAFLPGDQVGVWADVCVSASSISTCVFLPGSRRNIFDVCVLSKHIFVNFLKSFHFFGITHTSGDAPSKALSIHIKNHFSIKSRRVSFCLATAAMYKAIIYGPTTL